jgi:hypothetical protein
MIVRVSWSPPFSLSGDRWRGEPEGRRACQLDAGRLGLDRPGVTVTDDDHVVRAQRCGDGMWVLAAEFPDLTVEAAVTADPGKQVILLHVEDLRPGRGAEVGGGAAVPAAVVRAFVDPVRVHEPAAVPAVHQPGQCVVARHAVDRDRCGVHGLHPDELLSPTSGGWTTLREIAHCDDDVQRRTSCSRNSSPCPSTGSWSVCCRFQHLPSGVARVGQDRRHRAHRPCLTAAMRVAGRVGARRARHAALVAFPSDAGHAASGQPLLEYPPHVRRGDRIWSEPVQPSAPLRYRARDTSRCDRTPSRSITARWRGLSKSTGPYVSGDHSATPCRRRTGVKCASC